MITIEDSIPKRSEKYLLGQDVIWTQFNDINFYVEDIDQENFYLQIIKKLFPEIKINRIFPLGGKGLVINLAKRSLKNKKKVFILDLDFDDILDKKEMIGNVFYLDKYSIENHLLNRVAIHEIIKEENPKISGTEIKQKFDFNKFVKQGIKLYLELASHLLLINKFELGIHYLKLDLHRDCILNVSPYLIKSTVIDPYYFTIEKEFTIRHPKYRYAAQLKRLSKYFRSTRNGITNIPGKYWMSFLKWYLKKLFAFSQCSIDTFVYRLAKNCDFNDLNYLRLAIIKYTK